MPKNKKIEDSDSDSGPDDRQPVKKSKTESSSSGGGDGGNRPKTNDEGCPYWDLGMRKRVTVREFKGSVYVDVREFYEKDGKTLPGKKGISLKAGDWGLLKDLIGDIDSAVSSRR